MWIIFTTVLFINIHAPRKKRPDKAYKNKKRFEWILQTIVFIAFSVPSEQTWETTTKLIHHITVERWRSTYYSDIFHSSEPEHFLMTSSRITRNLKYSQESFVRLFFLSQGRPFQSALLSRLLRKRTTVTTDPYDCYAYYKSTFATFGKSYRAHDQ